MTANLRGILAIVGSMFCFNIGDTLFKVMGSTLPIGEMLLIRGVFATLIVLAAAWHTGALREFRSVATMAIAWRTFFEVACSVLFFVGLVHMSYSDAAAIGQFAPLMIMAGAALFLGEPVGWRRWSAAAVGFLGVMLIIKPGTSAFQPVALILLASMACVAARDLITRRLPKDIPTVLVTLTSAAGGMAIGPVMAPFEAGWRLPTAIEIVVMLVCAVTVLTGYALVIIGMRTGDTAVVSPFRYAYIIFAISSSLIVFKERPDTLTWIGIALVIGSGLYTLHRERVRRRASSVNSHATASSR